jgi:Fe-S oxidoreductase
VKALFSLLGLAAVDVLEHAGFEVVLPSTWACCGLTWISTGQLRAAKRVLKRTIAALTPFARKGTPIVGLEPSCTAVFRHDLTGLFPHDLDAHRISEQTVTLAELIDRTDGWQPPRLPSTAIMQGHCHHRAVMHMEADQRLLERVGVRAELLDSGCCGLAGNFGFERGHYDVSIACAERVLLPAVRDASPETIVMADGFSCRYQIAENTSRSALHLAEVLAMAIHQGQPGKVRKYEPELAFATSASSRPTDTPPGRVDR